MMFVFLVACYAKPPCAVLFAKWDSSDK